MKRLKGPSASLVRAMVRRIGPELSAHPNVSHVTVGEKISAGQRSGRRAIKVHVLRKGDADVALPRKLPILNRLGRKVGDVETDIVEIGGPARPFGLRAGSTLRAFDDDLGVAGLTFSKGSRRYVMTNAHVVRDVANGGQYGDVAWERNGGPQSLGPVVYATRLTPDALTDEDAAVARIDAAIAVDDWWIDVANVRIERLDDMRQSDRTHWFVAHGQIYTCAHPEPVDSETGVIVDGVEVRYHRFWQLEALEGDPQPGVSGALLCRTVNGRHVACGLVFAGIPGEFVWAFSFRSLFLRLDAGLPG